MSSSIQDVTIRTMQVVIVDDRCTDGSIDVMIHETKLLCDKYPFLILHLRDQRPALSTTNTKDNNNFNNNNSNNCRDLAIHSLREEPSLEPLVLVEDNTEITRPDTSRTTTTTTTTTTNVHAVPTTTKDHNTTVQIILEVVHSSRPGIGNALNSGLECCKYDLVARMDADDICLPGRFVRQMQTMIHNPIIAALGTSSVIFNNEPLHEEEEQLQQQQLEDHAEVVGGVGSSDHTDGIYESFPTVFHHHGSGKRRFHPDPGTKNPLRISAPPIDPTLAAWSMFFSCVISHPSVMLRASSIRAIGGYSRGGEIERSEDYDLWLRLLLHDFRSLHSLPILGIWHRKHRHIMNPLHPDDGKPILDREKGKDRSSNDHSSFSSSGSSSRSEIQKRESFILSKAAMTKLLHHHPHSASLPLLTDSTVNLLRNPHHHDIESVCANDFNDAVKILCALEHSFISKSGRNSSAKGMRLIKADCNARIGELVTIFVQKFGKEKLFIQDDGIWSMWCKRCPGHHLERLSILYSCE